MNDSSEQNVTPFAEEVVTQQPAETPPWVKPENAATQTDANATNNEQDEQRKARGGFQRRIDELVREREYERAEKQRLHDLLARQTGTSPRQESQSAAAAEQAPTLEQFDSYDKYLAAHARWEAKAVYAEQRKAEREETQRQEYETKQRNTIEQQQRAMVEQQNAVNKLSEDGQKKYPDFYEKVFAQNVPISPIVGQAIIEAGDAGMDVAYHLSTHPDEAMRIAKLSPTAQLREFGKLEVSLAKQQSAAPAPINPVGGKNSSSELPSSSDDMATWIAKRNRQLGRK